MLNLREVEAALPAVELEAALEEVVEVADSEVDVVVTTGVPEPITLDWVMVEDSAEDVTILFELANSEAAVMLLSNWFFTHSTA